MQKFEAFRKEYTSFIYKDFVMRRDNDGYHVAFHFSIPKLCDFESTWYFPATITADESVLERLVFNLGLVETISYWKCVCAPKLIIKCGTLTDEQCKWWKKLYFNGLGEFLYRNNIDVNEEDLVQISCDIDSLAPIKDNHQYDGCLVPIGGGKDSVVTLELLKNEKITTYCINSNTTTDNIIDLCSNKHGSYSTKRKLDAKLLELNKDGFLNGHIPFSAVVAFSSVIAAYLTGNKYIALSNETSANESTVSNTIINHQYSKSYEFEKDFTWYVNSMIDSDIHYFSLLRPLTEIQIANYFSKCKNYHKAFRSCNVGSKKGIWCCDCPKCLFVYIILAPFLCEKELIDIFGENLLNKESMDLYFRELTGIEENKPFECVGTRKEVLVALKTFCNRGGKSLLTDRYSQIIQREPVEIQDLLKEWENENNVPLTFIETVKGCQV